MSDLQKKVFQKASISHYNASLFFPKEVRENTSTVYAFVRSGDDLVDSIDSKREAFKQFQQNYLDAYKGKDSSSSIISDFVSLQNELGIPIEWVKAYFKSMEMDFDKSSYKTLDDTLEYIYGCAEVVGLMMTKVLGLDDQSHKSAQSLARAMQYANFLRDIDEDNSFGRCYFPKEDLKKFNLSDLTEQSARQNAQGYKQFINLQISRYYKWLDKGMAGYKYIPTKSLAAVKTAADMYLWTVKQIELDPFLPYKRKAKPTKLVVLATGLKNKVSSEIFNHV